MQDIAYLVMCLTEGFTPVLSNIHIHFSILNDRYHVYIVFIPTKLNGSWFKRAMNHKSARFGGAGMLTTHGCISQRHMVRDHWRRKSALVLIRPKQAESQMTVRPSFTRRGGWLTSACLMAVRNGVQGFLGNRCYKGWEGRRIGLQTASLVTLWQMWGFAPPKGAKQRKGLWIKGLLLSFLCSALSPAAHNQRKGQAVAWLQASGAFTGKTKQLSAGAGSSWRSPFPPSPAYSSR